MKNPANNVVKRLRILTEREYRAGYANGYKAAWKDLDNALAKLMVDPGTDQDEEEHVEEPKPWPAAWARPPKQEHSRVHVSEQGVGGKLSPRLRDAWTWLREHPGSTQQQAYNCRAVSNKAVFYKLRDRGFARKDGSQFFAIDTDSAP